ncbi:MAG: DUF1073 domain-containing protein [Nostoc sp. NMS7]|uniref:anti-CBASS protein Acb1 family protein n=1 Tax=Nostoc sp. NMS7 TaxID=2815391 RepID=UPI0025FDEE55|nr:anti-CBASS Acb1 family protein [Nostoc sp. NMS7]MBN3946427.1 DUF1073 domain-containing protein [Nostoc sp. NMS7]
MPENPFVEETEETRLDATLINAITQMGTGGDRSEYTFIGRSKRIPKEKLEELYRVPICRRVVRAKADSAVLKGWNLILGNDSDQKIIGTFTKYHDRLKTKEKLNEAQIQANIYGGAVIIIIADDGKNPDEPLDKTKIKTIVSLEVIDCNKIIPEIQLGINPADPEFYRLVLPEFLLRKFNELFANKEETNFLIHSSRIIRFDGYAYTPDMLYESQGWGGSILESLWEDYRDWKTSLKAIGAMVQDCSIFVYKLKGLAAMVKTNDELLLKSRLHLMRMMTSVFGGFAADADGESVEFPSRNFSGVGEIATQLRDAFIGASGIPHDRLFGESPSGLGATGESEEKNWSSDVAAFQQIEWLPKLKVIGQLIFLAKDGPSKGVEPDDWGFDFPSLLQESETDIVSSRSTQSTTDNTYLSAGVLLPEEVRASRFGGSKYSVETTLDEKLYAKKQKEAEDQQAQQQQQFGGDDGSEDDGTDTTNQDSLNEVGSVRSEVGSKKSNTSDFRLPTSDFRKDGADPVKKIVNWNGISIGVTHEPKDSRFPLSRPMKSSYGHIRRSYGDAPDGKALDVYLGDRLESEQAYKVRQLDPTTGMPDEDKYFIGFQDSLSARDCFNYHAGRDRFGGIENVDPTELQVYRQDNCSLGEPRLSSGVQTFDNKLFAGGAPTSSDVLQIVQSTYPEEVLKLGDWKYLADGTADGEFYTPIGVYGFGIKDKYCGYAWKRELRTDSTTRKRKDSDPVRSGAKKKDQYEVLDSNSNKEDIVDLIVKQYAKKLPINNWIQAISGNLKDFSSLEDLRDRIPDLYSKINPKIFIQVIEQSRMLAQLAGMADVGDELDEEMSDPTRTDAKAPAWLSQPFKQAIAYFRKKVIIPTQRWDEFTAQNHDFAFTVSGLTRGDLLSDVRWLVDQAISKGNDLETFTSQFKRLVGRKGWKPSDKRIYTILDTNSRRAYAAGRYEQATSPDMLERRPYWVWKHRDSVIPRPNHLALDNKAIPANHPFWKVAFPSCAFGCRCSAFTANERMLRRIGAQILDNPPDPKTIAETGFQRAPGLAPDEDREDVLQQGLQRLSPDIAQKARNDVENI